jgi:hypothetical protein
MWKNSNHSELCIGGSYKPALIVKQNSSVEQGFKVISNVIVEVAPTLKFVIYYLKKVQYENFAGMCGINFEFFTTFG